MDQECWNSAERLGHIAFDVIRNDFHRPITSGKCDRENIENHVLDGVYQAELPPMNEADVAFICDIVDDLIIINTNNGEVT